MSKKNIDKNWAELCASSKGSMIMVPDVMTENADEFLKKTDDFLKLSKEFNKANADFDVYAKTFWHKMRQAIEEKGIVNDIYEKNIGWNMQAKEDGVKVINIISGNQPTQIR